MHLGEYGEIFPVSVLPMFIVDYFPLILPDRVIDEDRKNRLNELNDLVNKLRAEIGFKIGDFELE